jgi:diacylglycerol diphosphate phosphatase / phosphatidate phosphatase
MGAFKTRLVQHIKEIWPDILTIAILGGATLGMHQAPLAATRTFPLTLDPQGNVVYPSTEMGYPFRGWIIPTWASAVVNVLGPIVFILLTQIRVRSLWDVTNGIEGVLLANICSTMFQVAVKKLIGGFRPYFLDICQPDVSLAKGKSGGGGLDASGFRQVFYTIDICTNPNKQQIETAATSFPSGHSVAAFAGFGFLFLYWNAKFKIWADHKPALWKIWIVYAPLLVAFLLSCALGIDAAHNWYDIAVGMAIGVIFAFGTYRMMYAAIWDWRFNHIPLLRKGYAYPVEGYERTGVFTRAGGWGRHTDDRVDVRHTGGPSARSARSSATIPNGGPSRDRYANAMV